MLIDYFAIFAVLYGLVIGSFLTACIHRLPRRKGYEELHDEGFMPMDLTHPRRSMCPACKNQLRWYHNIPFFAYVIQLGRCQFCKTFISPRYPLTELTSSLLALFCYLHFGASLTAAALFIFLAAMLVVFWVDYDFYIIPDDITLKGSALAIVLAILQEFYPILNWPFVRGVEQAFWGFICGAGTLWAIGEFYRIVRKKDGMGLGDVKLLMLMGLLFGGTAAINTIFYGCIIGTLIMGSMTVASRGSMSRYIPFGPFLVIGFFLWLTIGPFVSFGPMTRGLLLM